MTEIVPAAGLTADWLARAYIDELAKAENVKNKPMVNALLPSDPVAALFDELDGSDADDGPHLRVDLVMAAVLTAKAVAGEEGSARRLRREAPIVTVETHTADMVPLVTRTLTDLLRRRQKFESLKRNCDVRLSELGDGSWHN